MTRSLFNECESYNEDARELQDRADAFARQLLEEFVARGYTHREVSHVIQSTIGYVESELVLRSALTRRRAAKKA